MASATLTRHVPTDNVENVTLWKIRQFFRYGWREVHLRIFLAFLPLLKWAIPGLNVLHSQTYLKKFLNVPDIGAGLTFQGVVGSNLAYTDADGLPHYYPLAQARMEGFRVLDFGLVGVHLVVTAGKNYVASTFDNTAEPESMKFHGFGTGTTSAAAGDTALQTELTTQYATDSTRPTGSQAHSSATYTTVATLTPDASCAITEWGLFSAASSGTLLDRQVFSAVNLNGSGDSLQTTYVLTIS